MKESVQPTATELHLAQTSLLKILSQASKDDVKTLLFVYYRGNGGLDMRCLDTYAILQNGKAFAIEHFIRDLALIENVYVFSLLDCPRKKLVYPIDDGYSWKADGVRNLILMFGCKQLQDLKQPTFWALFNLLKRKRNPSMNSIKLPDALIYLDQEDKTLQQQFDDQHEYEKDLSE